ncbi:hypothetical protein HDU93_009891 [Gonapodya sp. JEL0774]|nr:hypothetical protein HDU93_009891 [Gonapodya sp. JEL0774]
MDWDLGALLADDAGNSDLPLLEAPNSEFTDNPNTDTTDSRKDYVIVGRTDAQKEALFKNKAFRLLLRLLKLVEWPPAQDECKLELDGNSYDIRFHHDMLLDFKANFKIDGADRHWIVPADLEAGELLEDRAMLNAFLEVPLQLDGKPASKLLRKRKNKKRRTKDPSEKVKRTKMKESKSSNLSAQLVVEDDSDINDEEFFKREAELRERLAQTYSHKQAEAEKQTMEKELEKMQKRKVAAVARKEKRRKGQEEDSVVGGEKSTDVAETAASASDNDHLSPISSSDSDSSASSSDLSSSSEGEDANSTPDGPSNPFWKSVRRGGVESSRADNGKFLETDDVEQTPLLEDTSSGPRRRLRLGRHTEVVDAISAGPSTAVSSTIPVAAEQFGSEVKKARELESADEVETQLAGVTKRRRLLVEDSDEE